MRRLSTHCLLATAWLWLGWPQPHLHAQCTVPAATIVLASDNPFTGCFGTITIQGTLEMDGNLDLRSLAIDQMIVSSTGSILFTSNATTKLRLPAHADLILQNGSTLEVAGNASCSHKQRIEIGSTLATCDGSTGGADYSFPEILNAGGFNNNSLLPVELTAFYGQPAPAGVSLHWTTATELNNDYFDVERSTDGRSFRAVGRVAGAGTTHETQRYSYLDRNLDAGGYYYRLRQVDFDGSQEHSPVIFVRTGAATPAARIFPNPARESFRLDLPEQADDLHLRLIHPAGQAVPLAYQAAGKSLEVNLPAGLAPGLYYLEVVNGDLRRVLSLVVR